MTDVRTVLFDLDGTLADTAPDLGFALNTLLLEEGRDALPYPPIRAAASHGARALIKLGFGLSPDNAGFESLRQRFLKIYADNICRHTIVFAGMGDVISAIAKRGLKWGIVTNKPRFLTEVLVQRLGLHEQATCVISGDTTQHSKPHPEPVLHACGKADSHPDACVYIGDAERDIEAGRRAGTKTLVALFGYLGPHDRPETWGADGLLRAPADILTWLDQQEAA
jgi:2-phosphoglycolate phosphatase